MPSSRTSRRSVLRTGPAENKTRFAGVFVAIAVASITAVGMTTWPSVGATARTSSNHANTVEHRDGCERTTTRVRLTKNDPSKYRVAGWLCGPRHPRNQRVEFLIHGFSYNHLYWFGLGYRKLDYVREAAQTGRSTFVIDQLGTGKSDHPDPRQTTFTNLAYVVHQLVTDLKAGHIGRSGTKFQHVVGVGHSMGARTWVLEAGTYHDVDSLILAGALADNNVDYVNIVKAHTVPANTLRPRFASLPDGYLSVEPRSLFYDTNLADPKVIAQDEKIGIDTGTLGQLTTLPVSDQMRQYSQSITAPVLIVMGRQDANNCNEAIAGLSCASAKAVVAREGISYTSSSCLGAYVLDSGHDTNLHPKAPTWYRYADWWLKRANHHTSSHHGGRHPCAVRR